MTEPTKNQIICAAIRCDNGYIIRGHRHNDCFKTLWDIPLEHRPKFTRLPENQGFMDARNQFVSRAQALTIQIVAGIESARESGYQGELYSEDLY